MKKYLKRKLRMFLGIDSLEEDVVSLQESRGNVHELEQNVDEFAGMAESVVEANHRLQKLEEYLGVEYVSEVVIPKAFIGYKKKKR